MKKAYFFLKWRRFLAKYNLFWRLLFSLALLFFIFCLLFLAVKGVWFLGERLLWGPRFVANFLESPEENLAFSGGRTNVLILGIAGGEHQGADLTDTIIFASVNIKTGDTVMLSIPRDIWLESLKTKINSAYHYGEEREKRGGFVLARDAVYQIVGLPIYYTFLINFEGFVEAVDLVEGIRVKVDRTFDDFKYPIPGRENDDCGGDPQYQCRFEHLHFEAGWQEMDGETALKFVRSRNAEGEEGTDFARSQRQQKVIRQLTEKIISARFLTKPAKLKQLINLINIYVKSDPLLKDAEIASFTNLLVRFIRAKSEIRTLTLDTGTEENPGFLVNPPPSPEYDNQWVLLPRNGDFSQFQEYFTQKIKSGY